MYIIRKLQYNLGIVSTAWTWTKKILFELKSKVAFKNFVSKFECKKKLFRFFLGTYRPENNCPCNGECIPTGLLNMSACAMGSPTFLSLPHFYGADPYYLTLIDGLRPSKEKHDFSFTLEEVCWAILLISGKTNGLSN